MSRAPDKRPFALTSALLLCLFFGFWGARDSWLDISLFRNFPVDPPMEELVHADAEQRANVAAAIATLASEMDLARPRAFPLAVAGLVLGLATVFFAMRAFARMPGSRSALWQLALAQTALVVGTHFALPRFSQARVATISAIQRARQAELPPEQKASSEQVIKMLPAIPAAGTAVRSILGLLVVLVLIRRSTREYFDSVQPAPEQG